MTTTQAPVIASTQKPFGYWFDKQKTFIMNCNVDFRFDETEKAKLLLPLYTHAQPASAPTQAQPVAVDAWQPIETAPKDGSMILLGKLANIDDDDWAISTAGFWQEAAEDSADDMSLDAGFVDAQYQQFVPARSFGLSHYRSLGCQPTHWQPLPTPPNGITLKETP